MAYIAEFWLILESNLVERALQKNLMNSSETITEHTIECNLTNTIGLIEFGSVMNKL
jgi:hypothetical protein